MSSEIIRDVLTKSRGEITFADALDLWLAVAGRVGLNGGAPVLPVTLRKYRQVARDYIRPHFGDMKLREITPPVVARFRTELLTRHSRCLATQALKDLRSCLESCRLQGLISTNPAADIRIVTTLHQENRLIMPTRAEAQRLLAAADVRAAAADQRRRPAWLRNRGVVYTLRFTGMRIGEVLGLPWSAIDTWTHRLHVRQMVDQNGNIVDPKSRVSHRTLDIPPPLMRLLLDWQRDCPWSDSGLIFPTISGKPWPPTNFAQTAWRVMSEHAGLTNPDGRPAFTRHSFRHLFASELIDGGATILEVQAILGHARATTTLRYYGHLFHGAENTARRRRFVERIAEDGWPA